MVSIFRLSHSVHFAVCTVTRLYLLSSTVHAWTELPPGVRGVRVGNGLCAARGVAGGSVRNGPPGVTGTGVDFSLALWLGPGVAGGSMGAGPSVAARSLILSRRVCSSLNLVL
jgi:hypothetical protein